MVTDHQRKRRYCHVIAGAAYLALALAVTWPLISRSNTHVVTSEQSIRMVAHLNIWTLAWNHHWLTDSNVNYWDANIFHPHRFSFAYSEPQFVTSLLAFPVVALGGDIVLAYNMVLIAFFWIAAMSIYSILWWQFSFFPNIPLPNKLVAAFAGGLLFAFNPYMFREIGVLQLLATAFPVFTLFGLHRFFSRQRWVDGAFAALGYLATWYTCAYYGLFLSVFCVLLPFFFFRSEHLNRHFILKTVLFVMMTGLCLGPFAVGMAAAKKSMALARPKPLVQRLSATLAEYFVFPSNSFLYGRLLHIGTERNSYFVGLILVTFGGLGTVVMLHNRSIAPLRKSPAVETFVPDPKICSELRRNGIFYGSMSVLALILSAGLAFAPTSPEGLGVFSFVYWMSPYNLLYEFAPGFSSIRSAYRFSTFLTLFLSVPSGWAVLWILSKVRPGHRTMLSLLLLGFILLELWPLQLQTFKVTKTEEQSAIYQHVRQLPASNAIIELPMGDPAPKKLPDSSSYMYASIFYWHPLVNGYSGFAPQSYQQLVEIITKGEPAKIRSAFRAFGVSNVVIHWNLLTPPEQKTCEDLEKLCLTKMASEKSDTLFSVDYSKIPSECRMPEAISASVFEGRQNARGEAVVAFAYRLTDAECFLSTPWENPVSCNIFWHAGNTNDAPRFVSRASYPGSYLIQNNSILKLNVRTPSPGQYRCIVRHTLSSNSTHFVLDCTILRSGFVISNPVR